MNPLTLPLLQVRLVARQLCAALAHLHERGVVHCDLKPRNVVRQGRQYKLIDLDATASAGSERVGHKLSTAYVPPEMIVARGSHECDVAITDAWCEHGYLHWHGVDVGRCQCWCHA